MGTSRASAVDPDLPRRDAERGDERPWPRHGGPLAAWSAARLAATPVRALPVFGGPHPLAGDLPPPLARALFRLHAELALAGLAYLRPRAYLADEWFSPEGLAAIAVPFWLADPRLAALERAARGEAEGDTAAWTAALLRHEAGHCFDHAYGIAARPDFRAVFGAPRPYRVGRYRADDRSRDFVRHLPGGYAQAHPDEDFAETFAVVVTPGSRWRERYAGWPVALEKLEYVAGLVRRLGATRPRAEALVAEDLCAARRIRRDVAAFFAARARTAPPAGQMLPSAAPPRAAESAG